MGRHLTLGGKAGGDFYNALLTQLSEQTTDRGRAQLLVRRFGIQRTGTPLATVQAAAGHARSGMTLRYTEAVDARQARKMLKLRYGWAVAS